MLPTTKDSESFEKELIKRLRHDKLLLISEIRELGEVCGLDKSEVAARLAQLTQRKMGFKTEVYISNDLPDSEEGAAKAIVKKLSGMGPYR